MFRGYLKVVIFVLVIMFYLVVGNNNNCKVGSNCLIGKNFFIRYLLIKEWYYGV